MEEMRDFLAPHQLSYGTPLRAEAAAHAARIYLQNLPNHCLLLKLDLKNAFNCLCRDKMLLAVREVVPDLLPLIHSIYSAPSHLFIGDEVQSAEGVQQGDPLGPLLFCLTIHSIVRQLRSELRIFYLDDGTLGGTLDDVLNDLQMVEKAAEDDGLQLSRAKSSRDVNTKQAILSVEQDLRVIDPDCATLLGSPIGSTEGIDATIMAKTDALKIIGSRLHHLHAHDAFCLLHHAYSIPKLLYILRTSPCFRSTELEKFDCLQRSILSDIANSNLVDNHSAWTQASLPVRAAGGLGVRSAVQLAPSAFLASAAGPSNLIRQILPCQLHGLPYSATVNALACWSQSYNEPPPSAPACFRQKALDNPQVLVSYDNLLDSAPDTHSRSRLLAASRKESGAWLYAFPMSALGLWMDDEVIRIAMGLRLGVTLCHPHTCCQCGAHLDGLATHGLSCPKSQGRHPRHTAINDLVKRSLASAKIPSHLEPTGIYRADGKRSDGASITPWRSGRVLVWDATCPDTFAPSHTPRATREAGAVANEAESRKKVKYASLMSSHITLFPLPLRRLGCSA